MHDTHSQNETATVLCGQRRRQGFFMSSFNANQLTPCVNQKGAELEEHSHFQCDFFQKNRKGINTCLFPIFRYENRNPMWTQRIFWIRNHSCYLHQNKFESCPERNTSARETNVCGPPRGLHFCVCWPVFLGTQFNIFFFLKKKASITEACNTF